MRIFMTLQADGSTVEGFYLEDVFGEYPNSSYPANVQEITEEQWFDFINNQGFRKWNSNTSNFDVVQPVASPNLVPSFVSNYQARALLIQQGLFSKVDTALRHADQTQQSNQIALAAWDYANDYYRDSAFVKAMSQVLSLTDAQIDQMFIDASQIV